MLELALCSLKQLKFPYNCNENTEPRLTCHESFLFVVHNNDTLIKCVLEISSDSHSRDFTKKERLSRYMIFISANICNGHVHVLLRCI